jgi:SAM-dependent methyltransferase
VGRVLDDEAQTYGDVWSGLDHYGDHAPGEGWAMPFAQVTGAREGASLLDAGCGSGKGAVALRVLGFDVAMCDITKEGLTEIAEDIPFVHACIWHDLRPVAYLANLSRKNVNADDADRVDWVYCCDVMEHLPKEYTMLAIRNMIDVARCGVFLAITFVPDHFGAMLGRPLHQTVESFVWWRDRLAELGTVVEARDCLNSGIFVVKGIV